MSRPMIETTEVADDGRRRRTGAKSGVGAELPDKVVKSAGRVLRILEFFDATRESASVIDVARALRVPQSSTSVLLRSMTLMGYLEYDSRSRTYRPTSRVAILGNWVNPVLVQRGGVLDTMRELCTRTGMTAVLAARNGLSAQYIHVVHAESNIGQPPIGATRPLATSAAGQVFLSLMPDLDVAKLIRRVNAYAEQGEHIVRVPDLMGRLAEIRRRGYSCSVSSHTPGNATLAMLVPIAQNSLVLGLSGPREEVESACETLVATMRRHVAGIVQLSDGKPLYRS